MSEDFDDVLEIVRKNPYTTRDGVKFVRKVVPSTEEYFNEYQIDLLINKYKLYDEKAKDYAKDNKFKIWEYNLSLMNEIFK